MQVICTKVDPNCNACPFRQGCRWYKSKLTRYVHILYGYLLELILAIHFIVHSELFTFYLYSVIKLVSCMTYVFVQQTVILVQVQ
jgi:hypothetical protein